MELQDNYSQLYRYIKQRHKLLRIKIPPYVGQYDPDGCDDPDRFLDLSPLEQLTLVRWVLDTLAPSKGINYIESSYSLKHYFNDSSCGFYVLNGCMKGALIIAGFKVADMKCKNWNVNVRSSSITNLYRTKANISEKEIKR